MTKAGWASLGKLTSVEPNWANAEPKLEIDFSLELMEMSEIDFFGGGKG